MSTRDEVPEEWRCKVCGWCRTYARIDERQPGGKYRPGPYVRCVNCKAESLYPEAVAYPSAIASQDTQP